jgi:hypothetical protein
VNGSLVDPENHLLATWRHLSLAHPSRTQRQNPLVKACPSGLVLGHDLRLKAGVAVTRDVDRQSAKIAFERFVLLPLQTFPAGLATASRLA